MYIFLFNIFRSCPDRLLGNILCYLYALKRIYVHIIKTIIINNILFDSILLLTLAAESTVLVSIRPILGVSYVSLMISVLLILLLLIR